MKHFTVFSAAIVLLCAFLVLRQVADDTSPRAERVQAPAAGTVRPNQVQMPLTQPSAAVTETPHAPGLDPTVSSPIDDEDLRFALERIDAGDREMAVLLEVYREKLKKADFEAEVARAVRQESNGDPKNGIFMAAILKGRAQSAESQVNEARLAIKQMVYHRRRNAP